MAELCRIDRQTLERAADELRDGRGDEARSLLKRAVQADRRSEHGWLWLAEALEDEEEKRFCLIQVLAINPRNGLARRQLQALGLKTWGPGAARSPFASWSGPYPSDSSPWALIRSRASSNHPDTRAEPAAVDAITALGALGYLIVLAAAEVLTAFFEPRAGLLLHGFILLVLLLHTALAWKASWDHHRWERSDYRLLLSLALAPLIRLLSLSLPLSSFPIVYWYFIISIPLFVATFFTMRVLNLGADEVGLNLRRLPVQIGIIFIGPLLGYIEYMILQPRPLAPALTAAHIWLPALILLVSTGFAEELIFRGVMQRTAIDVLGRWGIPYISALFAILHVGYHSLVDVVFVFGVALLFGWIVKRTGSITGVSIAHGLTNIFLFLVMPFIAGW